MAELYHYGVLGMKWGVRRYQNTDGTLTAEGRRHAREEYRADNKEAYEKGKLATINSQAGVIAANRLASAQNRADRRLEKDSKGTKRMTKRALNNLLDHTNAATQLSVMSAITRKDAEDHCKSLIEKYGKEAVKPIKYKDVKLNKAARDRTSKPTARVINERVNDLSDWARAGFLTMASFSTGFLGVPFFVLFRPTTAKEKATRLANDVYFENRNKRKASEKQGKNKNQMLVQYTGQNEKGEYLVEVLYPDNTTETIVVGNKK